MTFLKESILFCKIYLLSYKLGMYKIQQSFHTNAFHLPSTLKNKNELETTKYEKQKG